MGGGGSEGWVEGGGARCADSLTGRRCLGFPSMLQAVLVRLATACLVCPTLRGTLCRAPASAPRAEALAAVPSGCRRRSDGCDGS